ncbi:MAG: 23S rRNA (pseudouridine(1915)-N(3))-methyltransferase RlmH [Pseudomonadota bacterium]
MRITLGAIGRLKKGPEQELVARYIDRTGKAGRAVGITGINTVELPESRLDTAALRQRDEMEGLLARVGSAEPLIVFDERGKNPTSRQFAKLLGRALDRGASHTACLIGGPDGLDESLRNKADHVIGFGALTMPHQIARILVAEQLYRAVTILTNHPYHRD